MRAFEFTSKKHELNYILNMRAEGNYPEIPLKIWIQILENFAISKKYLKEDLDKDTVESIKLLKSFGVPPKIGKKYIPIEILILNSGVQIMVNGTFPAESPAKFLTLDNFTSTTMKFGNRELPNNYLSKVVLSDVILLDSVEKYEQLRTWVKLKFDIDLPFAAKELDEDVNDNLFWTGYEKKKPILDGQFILVATAGYVGYGAKPDHRSNQFRIVVKTAKGSEIGWVNFEKHDDHLEALDLSIQPAFRRKGIATEMYKFARELGNNIAKSKLQTGMGKVFWAKDHSK